MVGSRITSILFLNYLFSSFGTSGYFYFIFEIFVSKPGYL